MVIIRFMFHQTTIKRLSRQHMAPIILKLNFVVFSFTHSSLTRCSFNAINVMAIHLLPRFSIYVHLFHCFIFPLFHSRIWTLTFIFVSRHQHNQNTVNPLVKKVYFFWICPDTNAFEWFTDLLQYLEDRVSSIATMKF